MRSISIMCATLAAVFAVFAVVPVRAQDAPQVYRPGNDVTLPILVREVPPGYTHAAMPQRIEGTVLLEAVVKADGLVGDVTVVRSLDAEYGLDEEAVKAARMWEFKPGTREGKPVAVLITIELKFTLK
jgi:protein TonB